MYNSYEGGVWVYVALSGATRGKQGTIGLDFGRRTAH